jgi:transcriptional regulator with XRE-family HTH domain
MTVGEKIKKLREEKNISMRKLAEELGVSHAHISKVEKGEVGTSVDFLKSLANFFHIHISYFFIEEQNEFTTSQKDLLFEKDLSLENIKQKFNLNIDGQPATDEEIEKMLEYVRVLRQISANKGS